MEFVMLSLKSLMISRNHLTPSPDDPLNLTVIWPNGFKFLRIVES